ncbi:hypothetical protein HI914_03564 [Erysiphe necator]|nr:hypothetical protein HI914_03564 [Erysiphe necator]
MDNPYISIPSDGLKSEYMPLISASNSFHVECSSLPQEELQVKYLVHQLTVSKVLTGQNSKYHYFTNVLCVLFQMLYVLLDLAVCARLLSCRNRPKFFFYN